MPINVFDAVTNKNWSNFYQRATLIYGPWSQEYGWGAVNAYETGHDK